MALPEIDLDKCTGCGDCIELCPGGVVTLANDKMIIIRPDECNYCTAGELYCPSGAIRYPFEIVLTVTDAS